MEQFPPAMAQATHRIIREESDNPDLYAAIKADSTRPLFFLTQFKCPVIGRDLGETVGSWVVREYKGSEK
jgi:uncharacterized protein with ATP-grasp and redox domains